MGLLLREWNASPSFSRTFVDPVLVKKVTKSTNEAELSEDDDMLFTDLL